MSVENSNEFQFSMYGGRQNFLLFLFGTQNENLHHQCMSFNIWLIHPHIGNNGIGVVHFQKTLYTIAHWCSIGRNFTTSLFSFSIKFKYGLALSQIWKKHISADSFHRQYLLSTISILNLTIIFPLRLFWHLSLSHWMMNGPQWLSCSLI